jgi:hypothetical protein
MEAGGAGTLIGGGRMIGDILGWAMVGLLWFGAAAIVVKRWRW